jgi:hypothetical protein
MNSGGPSLEVTSRMSVLPFFNLAATAAPTPRLDTKSSHEPTPSSRASLLTSLPSIHESSSSSTLTSASTSMLSRASTTMGGIPTAPPPPTPSVLPIGHTPVAGAPSVAAAAAAVAVSRHRSASVDNESGATTPSVPVGVGGVSDNEKQQHQQHHQRMVSTWQQPVFHTSSLLYDNDQSSSIDLRGHDGASIFVHSSSSTASSTLVPSSTLSTDADGGPLTVLPGVASHISGIPSHSTRRGDDRKMSESSSIGSSISIPIPLNVTMEGPVRRIVTLTGLLSTSTVADIKNNLVVYHG